MVHRARRAAIQSESITGTEGDDHILVTAPTAVDGLGGFDTLHFDFIASPVGVHLDLTQVWAGGVGLLNGHEIRNMEALGSAFLDSTTENNIIVGSAFDDVVILGAGYLERTVVYGDEGDDLLFVGGGGEDDPVVGHNFLNGGSGDDVLHGGAHGDDLLGEDGDDRLHGGGADDLLFGDTGRDTLHGDAGSDYLRGGAGNDRLFGGDGDDRLDGSLGSDVLNGGAGSDTAEYYGAEGGVIVNLALGGAFEAAGGVAVDLFVSIENVAGSFFSDLLTGSAGANVLIGDLGDDVLVGGGGADSLSGGEGADRFVFRGGEAGVDVIADFDAAAGDRIDLSAIDAIQRTKRDNAFTYIGDAAFSGRAGELRAAVDGDTWQVSGDRDGDGAADFSILVASPAPLVASDFIL
ncbi:MAG TPA: calcium-binding protein [Allosphingosinicella sp.]|nr:calcium-binding protein [Allosphingosinicella sp.]